MKVSEVRLYLYPKPNQAFQGWATIVLDEELKIRDVKVLNTVEFGIKIQFPTRTLNGRNIDIVHPISGKLRTHIEECVRKAYKQVTEGDTPCTTTEPPLATS